MVKLKRNPKTGAIEAYNEKGEKVGTVHTIGDEVKKEKPSKKKSP